MMVSISEEPVLPALLEIRKYKLPRLSILISHEKFRLMQFPLLPIKG